MGDPGPERGNQRRRIQQVVSRLGLEARSLALKARKDH